MKKIELVYKEILDNVETEKRKMTQADIARALGISLSTVNHALKPLKEMGAIKVNKRNFEVVNGKKILYLWASVRNLEKDVIYKTRVEFREIEKNMPSDIEFGAYSYYKFKFKDVPADYSEVYVYAKDLKEIKKRFKESKNRPNLFVLKKQFDKMSLSLLFVDLWNLKEWYARDFLKELEVRMNGILE